MPLVDLIDETFVVADRAALAARVADRSEWGRWWPGLELSVTEDRGLKGVRWAVSGPLEGTSEIWLEPFSDGVILHYYLRADPPGPRTGRAVDRRGERLRRRHALAWKRVVHALKDEMEAGRPPGVGRTRRTDVGEGAPRAPARRQ